MQVGVFILDVELGRFVSEQQVFIVVYDFFNVDIRYN